MKVYKGCALRNSEGCALSNSEGCALGSSAGQLPRLISRVVCPAVFNILICNYYTKGCALSNSEGCALGSSAGQLPRFISRVVCPAVLFTAILYIVAKLHLCHTDLYIAVRARHCRTVCCCKSYLQIISSRVSGAVDYFPCKVQSFDKL